MAETIEIAPTATQLSILAYRLVGSAYWGGWDPDSGYSWLARYGTTQQHSTLGYPGTGRHLTYSDNAGNFEHSRYWKWLYYITGATISTVNTVAPLFDFVTNTNGPEKSMAWYGTTFLFTHASPNTGTLFADCGATIATVQGDSTCFGGLSFVFGRPAGDWTIGDNTCFADMRGATLYDADGNAFGLGLPVVKTVTADGTVATIVYRATWTTAGVFVPVRMDVYGSISGPAADWLALTINRGVFDPGSPTGMKEAWHSLDNGDVFAGTLMFICGTRFPNQTTVES